MSTFRSRRAFFLEVAGYFRGVYPKGGHPRSNNPRINNDIRVTLQLRNSAVGLAVFAVG